MSVAAAQVEENLGYVYTHLLHPFIYSEGHSPFSTSWSRKRYMLCTSIRRFVQYVPQSAGFLCPPNPLGNSSYCFRFRGRADWESLHCLMAWIWDVPWHCQMWLAPHQCKNQTSNFECGTFLQCWVVPNFSKTCMVQFS